MKARTDMVVLRPKEDLDRKWASDTIFAPDSALTSADQIGMAKDAAAVCEVVSVGPGSEECPDTSRVKPGDVVVLPLYGASKVLISDGEAFIMCRFRGLAAVVTDLVKRAAEKRRKRDREAERKPDALPVMEP